MYATSSGTVTANFVLDTVPCTVKVQSVYSDDGTIYKDDGGTNIASSLGTFVDVSSTNYSDSSGGRLKIGNSAHQYNVADDLAITATPTAATATKGYYCEKIMYSTDGGSTWTLATTSPTSAAAKYDDANMSIAAFTLQPAHTSIMFRAYFKAYYFLTLYQSYTYDGSTYTYEAAPPRQVVVSSGGVARATYTYSGSGTYAQCGEDDEPYQRLVLVNTPPLTLNKHIVGSTGTYYEGNKLVVYAGEEVKLVYSSLAASDMISTVSYRNSLRFTTHHEPDELYLLRAWQGTGHTGDGDDSYGFGDLGTSLTATIDQTEHTVTFTATQSYLNVDILRSGKQRIAINGINSGADSGISIENIETEGYYYSGEQVGKVGGVGTELIVRLDNTSDTTCSYYFTGTNTVKDLEGETVAGFTITAYDNSDNVVADPVTNALSVKYYTISCSSMPAKNVYIVLGIQKQYLMRLSNAVVADSAGNKQMINETNSTSNDGATAESSATGNIGVINAYVNYDNSGGEPTYDSDIASDGAYHWIYKTDGNVYENNDYSSNNYLKQAGINKAGTKINAGKKVTYIFDFVGGSEASYSFLGWYEGKVEGGQITCDYKTKLSPKVEFEYTPKANTVIFAAVTRDMFLGGNFSSAGLYTGSDDTWTTGRILMDYNPVDKYYYYKFNTVTENQEYDFRCYDAKSGTKDGVSIVWNGYTGGEYLRAYGGTGDNTPESTDSVDIGRWNETSKTTGKFNLAPGWKTDGYDAPVTVKLYTDGGIHAESEYQWSMAYVSAGAGVFCTNFAAAEGGAAATFNTPTVSVETTTAEKTVNGVTYGGQTVTTTTQDSKYGTSDGGGHYESIVECQVKEKDGFITVSACPDNSGLELDAFVVYNLDTKESSAVTEYTTSGTGDAKTYIGVIQVPRLSNLYIVPVYTFTKTYMSTYGLESHDVYVKIPSSMKDNWGGLVAMYSQGAGTTSSGVWPGQLMIPTGDGETFKAPLSYKGLTGVTFNNYTSIWGGAGANFLSTYMSGGKTGSTTAYSEYDGTKIIQTYDYREPISILNNLKIDEDSNGINDVYATDEMSLNFSLKPGNKNSGTHGNSAFNTVAAANWEYLTDYSGKKHVDLNGEEASGTATYYVVCNYTTGYSTGTETYAPAPSTNSTHVVDWTVYDNSGNYIAGGTDWLSACYTDVTKDEGSYMRNIALAVLNAGQPVEGKAVKIAYEIPQDGDETKRYSGQWYAEGMDTTVNVNVIVGNKIGDDFYPSESASTTYASGTVSLVDPSDEKEAEDFTVAGQAAVTLKHSTGGSVKLRVSTTQNFVGWYYDNGDGYSFISSEQEITPTFNSDKTYYAFFSAAAKYVFTYTSRSGLTKSYMVNGTGATSSEMSTGVLDTVARNTDITTKLTALAAKVKIFNRTTTFALGEPVSNEDYTLTYNLTSTATPYRLTVYAYRGGTAPESIGYVEDTWATPIDVTTNASLGGGSSLVATKPSDHTNYVFVGWKQYIPGSGFTGPILSTQANFGYSITGNLTIAPYFAATAAEHDDTWNAYVDQNEITQELTDDSTGKIYNDSLLAFRYSSDTGLSYKTVDSYECGIVILAQSKDAYNNDTSKGYFDALHTNNATAKTKMLAYLTAIKGLGGGKTSAKMNSKYGDSYAFYIQAADISDLNRVSICQILDYDTFTGGQYMIAAYYKDTDGSYKVSDVTSSRYTVE